MSHHNELESSSNGYLSTSDIMAPYACTLFLQVMTMMFEVQDLAVASPATVSRCGMVYLEPSILGLSPFVHCWLQSLPEAVVPHRETLRTLFVKFLEVHTI